MVWRGRLKPLNFIVNMSHLEPFWCSGGSGALWGGFTDAFEGVPGRTSGSKIVNRTHSLAKWGVRRQKGEKPLCFDRF